MRYRVGNVRKHGNARTLAQMFYKALGYQKAIYNIEVAVYDMPKSVSESAGMGFSIYCNKTEPHSLEEFIKATEEEKPFPLLYMVASLDHADKKRITVTSIPPSSWNMIDAPAFMTTIGFEPNRIEQDVLMDFIDYLES